MLESEREYRMGRETTKSGWSCGTLELAAMSWQRPQRNRGRGPRSRIRPLLGKGRARKGDHVVAASMQYPVDRFNDGI